MPAPHGSCPPWSRPSGAAVMARTSRPPQKPPPARPPALVGATPRSPPGLARIAPGPVLFQAIAGPLPYLAQSLPLQTQRGPADAHRVWAGPARQQLPRGPRRAGHPRPQRLTVLVHPLVRRSASRRIRQTGQTAGPPLALPNPHGFTTPTRLFRPRRDALARRPSQEGLRPSTGPPILTCLDVRRQASTLTIL